MVGDDHQVARAEGGVDSAAGIRNEKRLDAQQFHHAYGEGNLLHCVSFVVVEAALHGDDSFAAERAEDQASLVTLHGRDRKIRNRCIVEGVCRFDAVGKRAEARAEYDSQFGCETVRLRTDVFAGLFNLF